MPNPDTSLALLDARAVAPGPRVMQHAYLWVLTSLTTAVGLLGLAYALSQYGEREAGRMIIASQGGAGYFAVVVNGLATHHGRPAR